MAPFTETLVTRVPLRWVIWLSAGGWVLVALALIVSTTQLGAATDHVTKHFRDRLVVSELENELLAYDHVAQLAGGGWTPPLVQLRARSERRLEVLVTELGDLAEGERERALVREVERHLQALRTQDARDARPDAAGEGSAEEELVAALASAEALERLKDVEIEGAREHAALVDRVANAIGAVALLMVLAAPLLLLAERRFVGRPLVGMTEAMRQLRVGRSARAPEHAPSELSHLARELNETADALAAQRRAQLAFVAGVAHDLRTPIGTLRTAAGVLGKKCGERHDEGIERTLAIVVRATERLARMVDDLIEASRIEAGELRLARERVDAREVARRCVEMFAGTSSSHEVTLAGPDEAASVHVDPWRLEQVIVNLLENAIKYSPAGGPVVVDVRRRGGEVVVAVSDRGEGIPPAQLGELFEPFRRGDQPHAKVPGSGLGLSIVRRIVTAHGGHIEVESAPKEGSTFRVRLAAADDIAAAGPDPQDPSRGRAVPD